MYGDVADVCDGIPLLFIMYMHVPLRHPGPRPRPLHMRMPLARCRQLPFVLRLVCAGCLLLCFVPSFSLSFTFLCLGWLYMCFFFEACNVFRCPAFKSAASSKVRVRCSVCVLRVPISYVVVCSCLRVLLLTRLLKLYVQRHRQPPPHQHNHRPQYISPPLA